MYRGPWCNSTSLLRGELHEVGDRYKKMRRVHVEAAAGGFYRDAARHCTTADHDDCLTSEAVHARAS